MEVLTWQQSEDYTQTFTPRESVSKLALVRRCVRWVLRALPPPLLLESQRKQQNLTNEKLRKMITTEYGKKNIYPNEPPIQLLPKQN